MRLGAQVRLFSGRCRSCYAHLPHLLEVNFAPVCSIPSLLSFRHIDIWPTIHYSLKIQRTGSALHAEPRYHVDGPLG